LRSQRQALEDRVKALHEKMRSERAAKKAEAEKAGAASAETTEPSATAGK